MIKKISIKNFRNSGGTPQDINLYYQFFGRDPESAPVVLVNHALTGNSEVTGQKGWWKELVGPGKVIDTLEYSVLAINIPGNGFGGGPEDLLHNYNEFSLRDIAQLFSLVLEKLKIGRLFAIIGGSIGGALAWELAALQPDLAQHIFPIAADFKSTDWVLGQCKVQDQILNNSAKPVHDARMHAMTFYRTPQSFSEKFRRKKNRENDQYEVNDWLEFHGRSLEERFSLPAYKLMNHLLTTIDISNGTGNFIAVAEKVKADIHIIAVDSDLFFLAEENRKDFSALKERKQNSFFHEIRSIHGHDAFLIEYPQLQEILKPIFQPKTSKNEKTQHNSLWNR